MLGIELFSRPGPSSQVGYPFQLYMKTRIQGSSTSHEPEVPEAEAINFASSESTTQASSKSKSSFAPLVLQSTKHIGISLKRRSKFSFKLVSSSFSQQPRNSRKDSILAKPAKLSELQKTVFGGILKQLNFLDVEH